MKTDALYPSRWLKSADVTKPVLATIKTVTVEKITDDGETKPVLAFKESTIKPMVLNRTNALTLESLYGPETDAWFNKTIVLFSTMVPFEGRVVSAIRVREPRPTSTAPSPAPASVPSPPASGAAPENQDDVPF